MPDNTSELQLNNNNLSSEINRRRTFAIISHPDAGKTTLTEKLLLYGGAIHLAGSVKARKSSAHATSDWMEIEKQRGISVTSSVMQFNYKNHCINILDTPGHQDFSEDTYRTLCAADAAIMLIDGAKGVEPQTIKLFHVCRRKGLPIFTFINKMDRAAKNPFDLMDELEKVLGINSTPMNWPIGTDGDFKGVYNRLNRQVELFDINKSDHGASRVLVNVKGLDDPELPVLIGESHYLQLKEDIELLDVAGDNFNLEMIKNSQLSPLFFGSAINNFGIETFLEEFLKISPPPGNQTIIRTDNKGEKLEEKLRADEKYFSAFVFKIQANMNPDHRDRMAFIRICSGAYKKDMEVILQRDKKKLRLNSVTQLMAQDRVNIEEAYAGDIIGIFDPGIFRIGDTLIEGKENFIFTDIPTFPAEHFARIYPKDSMKRKQFLKGMEQLAQEGAVQLYKQPDIGTETYIVGVVGVLQFEVLQHRLQNEYKVDLNLDRLNYRYARWVKYDENSVEYQKNMDFDFDTLNLSQTSLKVLDMDKRPVVLFESPWAIDWAKEKNKNCIFLEINDK